MAWTPAARVPRSGVSAREPRIGVDARGDALVAWLARDGRRYRVRAVRQRASGRFGTTRTLSRGGAGEHAVAVSSRGRAAVAWRRSDGRASRVEAAVGASARRFSSARILSAPGPAPLEPAVGVGDGGVAMVVWSRFDQGRTRVEAAVRQRVRSFGAPSVLSGAASPRGGRPSVAVSASGRALRRLGPGGIARLEVGAGRRGGLAAAAALSASVRDLTPSSVRRAEGGDCVIAI